MSRGLMLSDLREAPEKLVRQIETRLQIMFADRLVRDPIVESNTNDHARLAGLVIQMYQRLCDVEDELRLLKEKIESKEPKP